MQKINQFINQKISDVTEKEFFQLVNCIRFGEDTIDYAEIESKSFSNDANTLLLKCASISNKMHLFRQLFLKMKRSISLSDLNQTCAFELHKPLFDTYAATDHQSGGFYLLRSFKIH